MARGAGKQAANGATSDTPHFECEVSTALSLKNEKRAGGLFPQVNSGHAELLNALWRATRGAIGGSTREYVIKRPLLAP
jgi:hypothetical protein